MPSITEYFAQQHDVWEAMIFTSCEEVSVSELWSCTTGETPLFMREDLHLQRSELAPWLSSSDECAKGGLKSESQRSLRIVWIPRLIQQHILDVGEGIFRDIHMNFGHEIAYSSSRVSVAALGRVAGAASLTPTYFLSLHPKVSMTWSFDKKSGLSSVICIAEVSKIQTFKELLGQDFIQNIATQPMVPAVMYAVLLSMEIDKCHQQVKMQIRQVEVRTGHHDWKSRSETPALGDLTKLSAKVSGYQVRTASCVRKQDNLAEVLNFIKKQQRSKGLDSSEQDFDDPHSVLALVMALEEKAKAQQADVNFIQCRIKTQLDALYHLVAQKDALFNQEMSQDCKYLAIAAQRDSSSMKGIAAVTMFFLPGTFMSSLFSIPLFDWNAKTWAEIYRQEFWKPRLMMFLATTLPLMFITFTAWLLWSMFEILRRKKQLAGMRSQPDTKMPDNEVELTSLKHS